MIKTEGNKPPNFVLKNKTAFRLREDGRYWRDAGQWGFKYKYIDNKLVAWSPRISNTHRAELVEITEEEYKKDNRGYV